MRDVAVVLRKCCLLHILHFQLLKVLYYSLSLFLFRCYLASTSSGYQAFKYATLEFCASESICHEKAARSGETGFSEMPSAWFHFLKYSLLVIDMATKTIQEDMRQAAHATMADLSSARKDKSAATRTTFSRNRPVILLT